MDENSEPTDFERSLRDALMDYIMDASSGELPDPNAPGIDLYAQDIERWAWLQEFIPGIVVSSAGGVVPFQAEGLIHGLPFYYRDRHGVARFAVGEADDTGDLYGGRSLYSASCPTEEFLGQETFLRNWLYLIPRLQRSMFRFEFDSKDIRWIYEDGKAVDVELTGQERRWGIVGWGHTPEEGYEQALAFYSKETFPKVDQSVLDRTVELIELSEQPMNVDDRVFPDPEPVFEVQNIPGHLLWTPEDGA